MQIIDVMRRLNTEHEVRFLLTAYLETLQSHNADRRLPPGVAALPIRDTADVEARFTELLGAELSGLARSHCDTQGAIAREATEIFGAAFTRLQTLRDTRLKFSAPRAVVLMPRGDAAQQGYEAVSI
ncbi:MAG TPA: hypothetical protein VK663_02700 [Burkholderiales bacterium]|nr:hypothetical protein [Burkholderiales bacterium]